jgi:hypothetical protein
MPFPWLRRVELIASPSRAAGVSLEEENTYRSQGTRSTLLVSRSRCSAARPRAVAALRD